MGTIYRANGDIEAVEPLNGKDYKLAQLQEIVGGYIECVASRDGARLLVVNEEGKLQALAANANATKWMFTEGHADVVVGDAVVIGAKELK